MIEKIKNELISLSDEKYKEFSASLIPNVNNILGVRLPLLRKKAKEILKSDWQSFIKNNDDEYFELTMLESMIIAELNIDFDKVLNYSENFIKKINNWSVCDNFCANLKCIRKNKEKTKIFIKKYLKSKKEFENRFAFVILTNYFAKDDTDFVLDEIKKFNNDLYYAKMAAAWCLSVCFVEDFEKTINCVKNNKIHTSMLKKGITKAIESLRLNKTQKQMLKNLRTIF